MKISNARMLRMRNVYIDAAIDWISMDKDNETAFAMLSNILVFPSTHQRKARGFHRTVSLHRRFCVHRKSDLVVLSMDTSKMIRQIFGRILSMDTF